MFYAEVKNGYGNWTPIKLASEPTVSKGRIVRAETVGQIIRKMDNGYTKPIPQHYSQLTLAQLYNVLSPDGKFRSVHRQQPEPDIEDDGFVTVSTGAMV